MILDDTLEFADAVAANGTDASAIVGDYHDLGASPTTRDLAAGEDCWFVVQVVTAYASAGTSVEFQFRSSTATALTGGTTTTHITTGAISTASGIASGTTYAYRLPLGTYQRYIGAWKVTVGAVASGTINAFITKNVPKNAIYPNAAVSS